MKNPVNTPIRWLAVLVSAVGLCASAARAGGIGGHGRFEKIKGNPAMGYIELYESNLFLSALGGGIVGPSRRLGTTCNHGGNTCYDGVVTHDGCYCGDGLPAGVYSILVNQPLFFVAPKVVPEVVVPESGIATVNIELPIDFSTFFKNDWTASSESRWYQTFVATGTGIRGIAFSFAGPAPSSVSAGVLEDNGNPDVRNWTLIAERTDGAVGDVTDNWVRFRSAQCPTVPGKRYAVRLTANGGSIQPYKRNKDANSYPTAMGQAYNSAGVAQNFDMNITVFSDNDGTTVTMNRRAEGHGSLLDGNFSRKWGQTFVARSASLAAVDAWAAGADSQWNLDFRWRVYEGADAGGPTGPQIGPTKTTKAAFQAFGVGLHGVSYNRNEIRLTPGQTYFIEFEVVNPPPTSNGFNPFVMEDDPFDGGTGYFWTGTVWQQRSVVVAMTIIEYATIDPLIRVEPPAFSRRVFLGGQLPPDAFTVANAGNGTLEYTVQAIADWLEVAPTEGTSTGEADPFTITYSPQNLALGEHHEVIVISSTNASNNPVAVPVDLLVTTVPADFDGDTDVDLADFGHLQKCLSGANIAQPATACQNAKLDGDGDVDADDVVRFIDCLSGPDITADPACATP